MDDDPKWGLMLRRLEQGLEKQVPFLQIQQQISQRLLSAIIYVTLLLSVLYMPVVWWLYPVRTLPIMAILFTILGCVLALLLKRQARTLLAGYVFLIALSLSFALVSLVSGQVNPASFGMYAVLVVMAGLLLGWLGSVTVLVLSLFVAIGLYWVNGQTMLLPELLVRTPQTDLALQLAVFIMLAVLVHLVVSRLQTVVASLLEHQQALSRANADLQQEVQARRQAEERYRGLFDSVADAILVCDAQLQIIDVNRTAAALYGYKTDALKQQTLTTLVDPVCQAEYRRAVMRALAGAARFGECLHLDRHGQQLEVEYHTTPFQQQGQPCVLMSIRDISQRKETERSLQRSLRALRVLEETNQCIIYAKTEFQLLQQVCGVMTETGGYRLAWVGLADWEKMQVQAVAQAGFEEGYLQQLFITWDESEYGRGPTGTAIRTRRPSVTRDIFSDPDYMPWREEALRRGYASSAALPLNFGEQTLGVLNIYATEADAFDEDELALLLDLARNLAYGIQALRMSEEHRRAEHALRQSEARFRSLVGSMNDIVFILDQNERHTGIFGRWLKDSYMRETDFLGKRAREIMGPEAAAEHERANRKALRGDHAVYEWQVAVPDGVQHIQTAVSPLVDAEDKIVGVVGVGRDITELKQTQLALEKSQQNLRDLARQLVMAQEEERKRLSRELHDEAGQALTALKISLELLQTDLPPDFPELRHQLADIIGLADGTMEQIRMLAQVLRPPALDTVGLGPTLDGFCRRFASRTNLSIQYFGTPLPQLVDSLSISLYRFLQESLTNVARHARATRVVVELRVEAGLIYLCVKDDGCGFDADMVLSQTHPHGLGLVGMRERLELVAGKLQVESTPGQGSAVTAIVPLQEAL